MFEVLIVENKDFNPSQLESIIINHPMVKQVHTCSHSDEAIRFTKDNRPDIVFIDMKLELEDVCDGLKLGSVLKKINPNTDLIFMSEHQSYALHAFALHPFDFLLKPINKNQLFESIDALARQQFNYVSQERLVVKNKGELVFLDPNKIWFFEKQGNKLLVYQQDNLVENTNLVLAQLEKILPPNFIRVHNSYIINLQKVSRITVTSSRNYEVHFSGCKKTAWVSRQRFQKYQPFLKPINRDMLLPAGFFVM